MGEGLALNAVESVQPSALEDGLESLFFQLVAGQVGRLLVGVRADLNPVVVVGGGGQHESGKLFLLQSFGERQRISLFGERRHLEDNPAARYRRRRRQSLGLSRGDLAGSRRRL